ncbi:MAG: DUF2752 domain-containing protein [Flavobacteriia bacterium]|nr:DUF2752 domain-containing protein [Flavobacteriia bacterium]
MHHFNIKGNFGFPFFFIPSMKLFIVYKYFQARWLVSLVLAYMVFSILLNAFTAIDICIPCLWKSVFGFSCPGCGLTRAAISLIQLDFYRALAYNPLIFIVLPASVTYFVRDFYRYVTKYNRIN